MADKSKCRVKYKKNIDEDIKKSIVKNATSYKVEEDKITIPIGENIKTLEATKSVAQKLSEEVNNKYNAEKYGEVTSIEPHEEGTDINIHIPDLLLDAYEVKFNERTLQELREARESSPYKKQYVFFTRRLKALEKDLNKLDKESIEYEQKSVEIDNLLTQFESAVESQEHEQFRVLGAETLDRVEDYITRVEKGELKLTSKSLEYSEDVADTFSDFEDLSDRVIKLRKRLYPYIKEFTLDRINKYKTEKEEITQEKVDNQNKDINTFTKGTGTLSDLANYIGRTIGQIIKAAQNRVSTKNKKLTEKIQKEIDLLYEYSKKNNIPIQNMYDIFIQEHKDTLVLTKPFLDKETENPNYKKIIETPELKRFYKFYQDTIEEHEKSLPIKMGRFFIPNIKKKTTFGVIKSLIPVKTNKEGQFVGDENLMADILNTQYIKKIPSDQKSRDLGASLLQFGAFANNYEDMSNILPETRLLQKQLEYKYNSDGKQVERTFVKSADPSKRVNGKESNIYKMVEGFIEMQVKNNMKLTEGKIKVGNLYDEEGNPIGEKYINASDIADTALKWNSLLRIGFSPITALSNWLFGDVSNIIEAVGGRFFNITQLQQATNIFFNQNFNKDSTLYKWLEKLNPLMELEDFDQVEKVKLKTLENKMSLEKFKEYSYSMQKSGEKFLQSRTMLAVLIKEGYITPKGETTKEGDNLSQKEIELLADKIQRLNQSIHGRYSSRESAVLQQYTLYRLVSQFRKWVPSALESRFSSKHFDVRLGTEIEGRYVTMKNLIVNLSDTRKRLSEGKLTELEIYNLRKTLTEIILMSATFFLYAGIKGWDDDEKKKRLKNPYVKAGLSLLGRVSGDIEFFYSPGEVVKITSNAIPLSKTVGDLLQAIKYLPGALGEKAYYKTGSNKGKHKFIHKLGSVVPLVKPVQDIFRITSDNILEEQR